MSGKINEADYHHIYTNIVERYGENFIKNFPKIANHISVFINTRSDVLQTKNLGRHLYYTKSQENDFYDCVGIDRSEIAKIVSTSKVIPYKYNDEKEPLYNLLLIMSSFYEIHQKEMEKLYGTRVVAFHFIRMYLALRIYSICQRQIFKHDTNEAIMEYTVANLNKKYIITKVENVYEFVKYFMETNISSMEIDFRNIKDTDIYSYVSKLIHRLKEALKVVFRAFMKNYESGKTIVTEQIQLRNEEGKTYMTVTSSVSNTIEIFTNKVLQAFIQDGIKRNIVDIVCKKCNNCSREKATMLLTAIKNSKDNVLLTAIIKDIVSYWVISLKQTITSIHSISFIKRLTSAYSISNTYDTFIIDLKERLSEIVVKYGSDYVDTEKRSTLNGFKQVVYLYLVFYISSIE